MTSKFVPVPSLKYTNQLTQTQRSNTNEPRESSRQPYQARTVNAVDNEARSDLRGAHRAKKQSHGRSGEATGMVPPAAGPLPPPREPLYTFWGSRTNSHEMHILRF